MNTLFSIEGIPIQCSDDGKYGTYLGHGRIDDDGAGGNFWNDPDFQPDTTEHDRQGHALNAETFPYFVVPPQIRAAFKGVVIGCKGRITNILNGQSIDCLIGDIGPHTKLGELSSFAAKQLGLNPDGNCGGTEQLILKYEFWPDLPFTYDNVTYPLLPA
jgi:hypothetical protein